MPLHVARLRDSDLAAEESPEACWYAVLLWAASWHQLPAGSLPDNDAILAKLIGLGRDVRTFRKHRAAAMRGFVKCSDGRLYHAVVAEQVNAAWQSKLAQRWRTECARIKKANQRNGTDTQLPTFEEFLSALSLGTEATKAARVPKDNGECPEGQGVQETGTGTGTGTGNTEEAEASSLREPAPKGKVGKRKPETQIPDHYPDQAAIADGQRRFRDAGVDQDASRHAERFRNHALQNDRRCRDWAAAWRNWVIIEIDRAPKKAMPPESGPTFSGPPDVITAVTQALDPQRAAILLARCSWHDVPERALVSGNNVVVDTLRSGDVWQALRDIGVNVRLERAA